MKTFFNLVQEVQKKGLCYRCGGCVTFCTALNYGALKIDSKGKPAYGDMEKCIECGLCYSICPQITELDEQIKQQAAWSEPMGRVIETTVVRAKDKKIQGLAADGGTITALLLHLLDRNKIDGAIVIQPAEKFLPRPFLATTSEQIIDSSKIYLDHANGPTDLNERYKTFSTIEQFDPMIKKKLKRVAMVGTPCQIKSLRKMQALNLIPSDTIKFCFGLFCSGSFTFEKKQTDQLAVHAGISWEDVVQMSIKENLVLTLKSGKIKTIDFKHLIPLRRYACRFCEDYSAEFADISFGGMGAEQGWTTMMSRTPLGRAALADAKSYKSVEQFDLKKNPEFASQALKKVRTASYQKKKAAGLMRQQLSPNPVQVTI